jgi:hypothetical protein
MLRSFAQFLSFLFHPLLVVTYMLILLLVVNPYLFGVSNIGDKTSKLLIVQVFISTFFIPGFAVAMLRFTGLIKSLEMPTRQDRIGPLIITGIFYLWMFKNYQSNAQIPTAFTTFVLGAVIGLFIAFFINIFSKISIHAVGMGGLVGMVVITMLLFSDSTFIIDSTLVGMVEMSMNIVLFAAIIIAGAVGTSRLLLDAHEPMDLYGGYLVGFAAQFIALRFLF